MPSAGGGIVFYHHQLVVLVYLVRAELMTKQAVTLVTRPLFVLNLRGIERCGGACGTRAIIRKIICSYTVENVEIFHHLMAALPPSLLRLSLPSRPCNYAHSRTLKPHSSNPVIFPGFFPLESFERRKKKSNFTHPPCSS